jgi:hypothetical protein
MKDLVAVALASLLISTAARAGEKAAPVDLPAVHVNTTSTVRLHLPIDWTATSRPGEPEVTEARGGGFVVRVLRREGELGLDSLHIECMQFRLAGPMDTSPELRYEYDFVGGEVGEHRALDSVAIVTYDEPVEGHKLWRQRNITLVGKGESVCVVAHAPLSVWKKSKTAQKLLNSVLERIELAPWH